MPSDGTRRELSFPQSQLALSLDEVAKGLAEGTISRGQAIKLGGAALLGSIGLLSLFPGVAGAQGGCEDKQAINNRRCPESPCGRCPDCFCARTVGGRKRCLDFTDAFCPQTDECDRNRDCPGDELCVQVAGCCGSPKNLCVPPCPRDCPVSPPPPIAPTLGGARA
jgi:hypothetical protein